jgi:hypothetical protein
MHNILMLVLLMFSSSAFSAGYSLTFQGQTVVGYEYESTCQQLPVAINADWGYTAYYYHEVNYDSASPRCRIGAQGGANPKYITFTDAGLSCPEGSTEDANGQCVEVDCPTNDIIVLRCNLYELPHGADLCPVSVSYNNCQYVSCGSFYDQGTFDDGNGGVYEGYRWNACSTGIASTAADAVQFPDLSPSEAPSTHWSQPDEESTTISEPSTVTAPDGTTTTTEQEHYQNKPGDSITTTGGGTSSDDSTSPPATITKSSGQQIDIYDTKTTTQNPDGTTTVVENKTVYNKTPVQTTTTIHPDGTVDTHIVSGWTLETFDETTTSTYDADGNLTSSSTVSDGDPNILDNTGDPTGQPGTDADGYTGNGDGDGEGECDPIIEECGSEPFQPTDKDGLYEKTDKTYESVLTEFKNRVSNSAVGSAMTGFFDFNLAGTCPTWQVDTGYVGIITIDAQCSQAMASIWPLIAAILLAVAGFFAWRIAVE